MGNIQGERREQKDFVKKVGLFEAKVIAVNPDAEQYTELTGRVLDEDDKTTEYLGVSPDGNQVLRVDVWLENIKKEQDKDAEKFRVTFFLENKERENKDMTKKQYINTGGTCCWVDDPNHLPEWFKARDYRIAFTGEEDLYAFMRTWLGNLDYKKPATMLELEWKKLMKGNVSEIRNQINGEWCTNVVCLATVRTKDKDGEIKEYQGVYNRGFLPPYTLKNFRLVDYANEDIIAKLRVKKDLKNHEKFVLQLIGEYGCRDGYVLKDLRDYDPGEFIVSTNKTISTEGSDY